VTAQGGGWIPNPDKPSNWDTLSPDVKEAIRTQQQAHLNFRFKFIRRHLLNGSNRQHP
jgi:hypothetical protein